MTRVQRRESYKETIIEEIIRAESCSRERTQKEAENQQAEALRRLEQQQIDTFARSVDLIGNLTLVIKPGNTELSNKKWIEKKQTFREHSIRLLNKMLLDRRGGNDIWDPESIEARAYALFDMVARIWPEPVRR